MINNQVSEPVTNPSKLFTTAMEDSICKLIKELNQPRIISTEQKKGEKETLTRGAGSLAEGVCMSMQWPQSSHIAK